MRSLMYRRSPIRRFRTFKSKQDLSKIEESIETLNEAAGIIEEAISMITDVSRNLSNVTLYSAGGGEYNLTGNMDAYLLARLESFIDTKSDSNGAIYGYIADLEYSMKVIANGGEE